MGGNAELGRMAGHMRGRVIPGRVERLAQFLLGRIDGTYSGGWNLIGEDLKDHYRRVAADVLDFLAGEETDSAD